MNPCLQYLSRDSSTTPTRKHSISILEATGPQQVFYGFGVGFWGGICALDFAWFYLISNEIDILGKNTLINTLTSNWSAAESLTAKQIHTFI